MCDFFDGETYEPEVNTTPNIEFQINKFDEEEPLFQKCISIQNLFATSDYITKIKSLYENNIDSNYTSYSVNKGEEIVFCLRCKKTYKLHTINILVYVAVHEMAHTACPEVGHTILFNKIFKFLLENAIKLNIYSYEDYSNYPIIYCGMELHSNILN